MTNTRNDFDTFSCMTISTVIRIESVDFFQHDDYTQIDVECLTQDMFGEVFDLNLHLGTNDPAELSTYKETLKPGVIFTISDQAIMWGGGCMTLYFPNLLPFEGDKKAINKTLDDWYSRPNQQREWDLARQSQRTNGCIQDFKITGTKRRGEMAIVRIITSNDSIECHLRPETFRVYGHLLKNDAELVFLGLIHHTENSEDNKTRMLVDAIYRQQNNSNK